MHRLDRAAHRLDPNDPRVIEQARNVTRTTIVREAWERGQDLTIHGWVYGLKDGLLRDMGVTASDPKEAVEVYEAALAAFG